MLIPSTITALRTRRYTPTLYIPHTIHGFGYNPMNDGGRYSIQSPFVSNLPPTAAHFISAVYMPEFFVSIVYRECSAGLSQCKETVG